MVRLTLLLGVAWGLMACPGADAQQGSPDDTPLTREEFNNFLKEYKTFKAQYAEVSRENQQLRSELATLRGEVSTLKKQGGQVQMELAFSREREALRREVREEIRDRTDGLFSGTSNFTFGGFASTGFTNRRNTDSTFNASLAPILLWKPNDRVLFESRFDIFLAEEGTATELAYAQVSYLLNDYLTVGAGKFVLPFGIFWERARAPWINKLPTLPLVYERGLVGETGLGIQLRGGVPIGSTKLNYAVYVINGPDFKTNASDAGRLGFGRNRDNNNNKAVGGRIGFLPIPELEIGASILSGRVGSSGLLNDSIDTLVFGFDFSYGREFEAIKGRLDIRGEYVRVDTDAIKAFAPFSPFRFNNTRNGWYLQTAYRPTKVDLKLFEEVEVKNLEFILRYDQLDDPGPGRLGADRTQLTLGLDYWIRPNVVVKTAYKFDDASGGSDEDGFYAEIGIGF